MLLLLTPSLEGYRGVEGHRVQRHLEVSWLYKGPLCSGLWDAGAGPVGIPCQLARAE